MNSIHKRRERKPRFTLERATLVALVLHLLAGALVTVWPGLLRPAELMATPEQPPIEFNFVDTPETEPPPETPDTNVLSDVDRQAADAAEPTESPDPFSEGNTVARIVRPTPPPAEASDPAPASEPQPEQPATEPQPEATEPVEAAAEAAEESTEELVELSAEATEVAEEEVVEAAEATQPTTPLPPRPQSLRRSLSRPESFVDPQMYSNPDGGVGGELVFGAGGGVVAQAG